MRSCYPETRSEFFHVCQRPQITLDTFRDSCDQECRCECPYACIITEDSSWVRGVVCRCWILKGFAEYTLTIDRECPITTSCYGGPCYNMADCAPPMVYRDIQTGFLNSGESKTFAYRLTGNRSFVEWVLSGPVMSAPNCRANLMLICSWPGTVARILICMSMKHAIRNTNPVLLSLPISDLEAMHMLGFHIGWGETLLCKDIWKTGQWELSSDCTVIYRSGYEYSAGIKPSEYDWICPHLQPMSKPDDLNVTIPVPPTAYTIKAAELWKFKILKIFIQVRG